MRRKTEKGRKVVYAAKPMIVPVAQCNIDRGVPKDKDNCVFADAMKDKFGEVIEGVAVGTTVTKVFTPGQVTKYKTPSSVRPHLIKFDKTGKFSLPPGEYEFPPYPKQTSFGRHDQKNPHRHGTFSGKKEMPSRTSKLDRKAKKAS